MQAGDFESCFVNRTLELAASARWMWDVEIVEVSLDCDIFIGVADRALSVIGGTFKTMQAWMVHNNGGLWHGDERSKEKFPFTQGEHLGVLYNRVNGTVGLFKDGQPLGLAFTDVWGDLTLAVDVWGVGVKLRVTDVWHIPDDPVRPIELP